MRKFFAIYATQLTGDTLLKMLKHFEFVFHFYEFSCSCKTKQALLFFANKFS